MTDATALMKLVSKRDDLKASIEAQTNDLLAIQEKIAATCHHPITVKKSSYSPGGYDHTSRSCEWDECTICGAHFNSKETRGGYA